MNFLVKIGIGVDPITVDNEIEEAENWAIKAITSFFGIKKNSDLTLSFFHSIVNGLTNRLSYWTNNRQIETC